MFWEGKNEINGWKKKEEGINVREKKGINDWERKKKEFNTGR
jgi:hypothetical protein